jgi:hypothetical protein
MLLLLLASLTAFGILAVIGLEKVPYLVVPIFIALLVWGLFRIYNTLMRQAEMAYLKSKKVRTQVPVRTVDDEQVEPGEGQPRRDNGSG